MPDEGFRLPTSSYEVLTKIIMAYGTFAQPAPPIEVGRAIGLNESTISANGAFLAGVGVLDGTRQKVLSSRGRVLSRALEHEMPDEIRRGWRDILIEHDFIQKILAAVRIRKGMERSALQSHIAYSAGQSKSSPVMTGANALIDILRAGELLREEDGKLLAVTEQAQRTADSLDTQDSPGHGTEIGLTGQRSISADAIVVTQPPGIAMTSGTAITIQIQIQCSVSEVDALGPKLRQLIKELSYSAPNQGLEAESNTKSDTEDGE